MNQLYRFHLAGNAVLSVGVLLGFFGSCWGWAWGIAGFAAGTLVTGLVAALVIAARYSNEEVRADRVASRKALVDLLEKLKAELKPNEEEDGEDRR